MVGCQRNLRRVLTNEESPVKTFCVPGYGISSVPGRTRPEMNFVPVPEPVPESPVKSSTRPGTGTGYQALSPVPVPGSVTGTYNLSQKCAMKVTLEYMDLSRKYTYN